MLPTLLYRKCGSESTSLQEFVGENNRGVSGKPGRKLDGVLHKVLHFLTLGGEALTDLDAGAAAVEILSAVGVSGIKGAFL